MSSPQLPAPASNADATRRQGPRKRPLDAFVVARSVPAVPWRAREGTRNWYELAARSVRAYTPTMKVAFQDAARAIASECTCMRVRQTSRALSRLYDEN